MEAGQIRGEIHVELNSEIPFLQEVNDFLMSVTLAIPWFDPPQVYALRQALLEMGQNAIEWGNKHQSEQLVDIVYRIHADRVEIVVRDQGPGFDREPPGPRRLARRPGRPHGRPREARAPRRGVRPDDHRRDGRRDAL